MKKYVSYSELTLWERDREEYINRYIKGGETTPNVDMLIGTMIHNVVEDPRFEWLKQAREEFGFRGKKLLNLRKCITKLMITRPPETAAIMTADLDDFKLFIEMDGYSRKEKELDEYKTTKKSHWYPWQVHTNFQLDFYALTFYLRTHQFFREIRLREVDYGKGNIITHKTTRSYRDNKRTEDRIKSIVSEMKSLGIWKLRLSRQDRDKLKQGKLSL